MRGVRGQRHVLFDRRAGLNLAQWLKGWALPATYRTATVATLRWKLYRLAAKRVRHTRGCALRVKADLEKWRLLQSARLACAGLGG